MKKIKSGLSMFMAWLIAVQPFMLQAAGASSGGPVTETNAVISEAAPREALQPRELTGFLDDRRAEYRAERDASREAGLAEDGTPAELPPLSVLPVVDTALAAKASRVAADERLRVIVHLDFLPHAQVMEDVLANHKDELETLEADRVALLAAQASLRDPNAKTDAENLDAMARMTEAERTAFHFRP